MTTNDAPGYERPAPALTPEELDKGAAELRRMLALARAGDRSVLPAVREFLRCPGVAGRFGGNLGWDAMRTLVGRFCGKDLVAREALMQSLYNLRAALLSERASPTVAEDLLVDRVVATWLHLHHLEMLYAGLPEPTVSISLFYEKAITAAQQRYFAALELLRGQRRIALPPVQINVANEQVNVAATVSGEVPAAAANQAPAPLG